MKTTKLVMLVMTIAVALFILIPNLSWAAEDGATLYKTKCAACHGADGSRQTRGENPQPDRRRSEESVGCRSGKGRHREAEACGSCEVADTGPGEGGRFVHSRPAEEVKERLFPFAHPVWP